MTPRTLRGKVILVLAILVGLGLLGCPDEADRARGDGLDCEEIKAQLAECKESDSEECDDLMERAEECFEDKDG